MSSSYITSRPSESASYDALANVDAETFTRNQRPATAISDTLMSQSAFDDNQLEHVDSNDVDAPEGRYFNFIKPTSTGETQSSRLLDPTVGLRSGKDLDIASFLSNGGPRLNTSARSPPSEPNTQAPSNDPILNATTSDQPTNDTSTIPTSIRTSSDSPGIPQQPRQNANPDIQDIITGIVKLLNGNVNIHTNSQLAAQQQLAQQQAQRKPYPSRINNRGPPRISEAQPLPNDFEQVPPPISTHRPPPYPFDRPLDPGNNRPFINGVPLPEQVVPSMQSNYRPGFVSQNRPPWQRQRPRPPISNHRRPIPPYKPIPTMPEYRPEDDPQLTTLEIETIGPQSAASLDQNPTDPSYESNAYPVDDDEDTSDDNIEPSSTTPETPTVVASSKVPSKKEDFSKKKDKPKNSSEKKPQGPITAILDEQSMTTIIKSKSEANTEQYISPTTTTTTTTTITTTMVSFTPEQFATPTSQTTSSESVEESPVVTASTIESSFGETTAAQDSSISTTVTPTLSTMQHSLKQSTKPSIQQQPEPSSVVGGTDFQTNAYRPYGVPVPNPAEPYHPRPGIVLDDPEFKPGGSGRHPPRLPQPTRPQPPGYGEIFDVTLSAIQGPGSAGSKQTFKINPYGGGAQAVQNGDIIISANGDDGFVSIDGKRTYLNLFGDATETDSVQQPAATIVQTKTIQPLVDIAPSTTNAAAAATAMPTAATQQQAVSLCPSWIQCPNT